MSAAVYMVQRDFAVGDLVGNRRKLLDAAVRAQQCGAAVLLSPELSLTGYCPEDMLYNPAFMDDVAREWQTLIAEAPPNLAILAGLPWRDSDNGQVHNAAALIRNGRLEAVHKKHNLPNYSVFDERRYFCGSDEPPLFFAAEGHRYAVQICEDIWPEPQTWAAAIRQRADTALVLNASPFHLGKQEARRQTARRFAATSGTTLHYCNCIGGQDELIFDGASFVINAAGDVLTQFPAMQEHEGMDGDYPYPSDDEALYEALLLGIRDYAAKTGFGGVVLGLSGGVDSALVAVAAADALGGKNVLTVMMPSPHTSPASLTDAAAIARNIGSEWLEISIKPLMQAMDTALSPHLRPRQNDTTRENIQARLRGQLLMALSNNRNLLLLATGNKSEMACGYATLYGDMCGGFAPLKDLSKTRVWQLAKWRNRRNVVIPWRVIERPPSAELRDEQTDQDTLPPYEQIDAAIAAHLEERRPHTEVAQQWGDDFAAQFFALLEKSEYKRRQSAPGPKLTSRAFGRDWRMPIANRYRHV